ncbi:MAG: VWA domain-containing protein [Pseudomonadota bacterium]
MTDDPLDRLARAMQRHTPPPSDAARQAAVRAGLESFSAQSQGSAADARPISNRPERRAGFWHGVTTMIDRWTRPRILMGTSALATLAVAVVLTQNLTGPTAGLIPVAGGADDARLDETLAQPEASNLGSVAEQRTPSAPAEADFADGVSSVVDPRALQGRADLRQPQVQERGRSAPKATPPAVFQEPFFVSPGDSETTSPAQRAPVEPFIAPAPVIAESGTERYPDATPAPLKITAEDPVSTFSIDVDTASYALVRSSLNAGNLPPRGAVRVEEMLNYFNYAYPAPDDRAVPFATSVSVAPTPWNPDTQLLHIGIQGYDIAPADRPPLNLVFLIDTSGSMNDAAKLPLLVRSFKLLLDTLTPADSIAIVTYAGSAGLALEPTPATDRVAILGALDRLAAGGSTAGQAGLEQAYAVAERMAEPGDVSRVILATDGDFNVGLSDPGALEDFIAERRDQGTYLSVLGFGRGNYNDAVMQSLAQNGNGVAAYVDTLAEAQKVLVEDVTGSLFAIAEDVKIQIEFNPAQISEYRLIGYETRALNREDFNDDSVDAGEIGAGHQVTALYEVTPKGSAAERVSDLRYGPATPAADPGAEYAFLKLRYKLPGEDRSRLIETPVLPDRADIAASETQFAAAVAGFGRLLRGETLPGWDYAAARAQAAGARGEDPFGYRSELVNLIRIADALN